MWLRYFLPLVAVAALVGIGRSASAPVPEWTYRVVHVYPHDPTAFTQGLEFRDGFLYEGTGLEGRSTLRKDDLQTGKVLQDAKLDAALFGEGITVLKGRVTQLTWQAHKGFVYDQSSFRMLKSFAYPGEGWGLTNDGTNIYMSDGTDQIRVWDPVTLQERRRISVHEGLQSVSMLNELEWVRGEIFANVWQTDRIARISPADGHITGWIDMAGILPVRDRLQPVDVLNGIAYDAARDRLFVTGKLWPKLFEIRLVPKAHS